MGRKNQTSEDAMKKVHWPTWLATVIIFVLGIIATTIIFYARAGEHMKDAEIHTPMSTLQKDFVPRTEYEKDQTNLKKNIEDKFEYIKESLKRIEDKDRGQ